VRQHPPVTGNNISPFGDLASRSLRIPLEVDRPDPENRIFTHKDPIRWTLLNRGDILSALYAILLANPAVKPGWNGNPETRFKDWGRSVGAAVEHAHKIYCDRNAAERNAAMVDDAGAAPKPVSFRTQFLEAEGEDAHTVDLVDALTILERLKSGNPFVALDLAKAINDTSGTILSPENSAIIRDLLYSGKNKIDHDVSAKSVGRRLGIYIGEPVWTHDKQDILTLRVLPERKDNALQYRVERKPAQA
jgi:hypothetical protein